MDSLFNRNTNDVASNESGTTGATSQHAASDAPAAVVNPLYAGEPVGESATLASSPAATSDACAYVAEPAPQQVTPTKECDGKQPGRAVNLLLVATLAAVCGLAGGLAGGAIMSAATGGSTQAVQGGMQGGGMQGGGAPSANGTTGNSEGTANGSAPSGQVPTGAPDASGSSDASADGSTGESSNGAPSDAPAGTGDNSAPRRLPFPPSHSLVHIERHDHDQA